MKIIALDCGHGLKTAGKQTPDGIKEWSLNDKVRDKACSILSAYDCKIIHTDNDEGIVDESLASRVSKYINSGANAFISFHHNAFTGKWGKHTGIEVYVDKKATAEDLRLANLIYDKLVRYTSLKGRGVKKADFQVINQNKVPAVLVEGGFMDSSIDYLVITSDEGQTAYAKAVAEALIEFCGLSEKEAPSIPQTTKTIYDIAQEVIKGCYGNGTERKKKLKAMGYSYSAVQSLVNQILKGDNSVGTPSPQPLKKSNLEIAREVIQGKWGNGTARKQKLNGAGYDYSTIQKLVNQLCK